MLHRRGCVCTCRLVELMQHIECKINLIIFNTHKGTQFTASNMQQVEAFRAIIMQVCSPSITPVLIGVLVYHLLESYSA